MADIEPQPIEALLDYSIAQESGVIVKRQVIEHLSRESEYVATQQMRFNWSSGSSFVFGPTSRLEFDFRIEGDEKAVLKNANSDNANKNPGILLGHSVPASIFRDSKLRVGSVEIYDEHFVGMRIDADDLMSCSETYLRNTGSLMGYNDKPIGVEYKLADDDVSRFSVEDGKTQDLSVSIPLHHLAGFWSQPLLIPFGLMSGESELEIILQNATEAINWSGAAQTYKITNARLQLDTITLSDEIMTQILGIRDTVGVPYSFDTHTEAQRVFNATGKQTIELNQNVSRALTAFARIRPFTNDSTPGVDALSMSSYKATITDWRFRLGSQFYPENTAVLNAAQSFAETLKAYNNLQDCSRPPGQSFENYILLGNVIGVDLSRDPGISEDGAAGISTKANRNLVLEINFKAVSGGGGEKVFLYLHYEKALKILGSQILVST